MGKVQHILKPTITQKLQILKKIKRGYSINSICVNYKLHKSSVYRIIKQENALKNFVRTTESGPGKRCTLKKAEHPRMEKMLYKWFLKQREKNVPISAEILRSKASQLHSKIYRTNSGFNASDGWFKKFKRRHGIRFLKITGEKLSSKPHLIDPFVQEFKDYVDEHGLTLHQIYNADESGLYYRMLPNHTLVTCSEKTAPGRKVCKERITFLPCANASGTDKLKLLVVGKSKNPRAFKCFLNNPVIYESSKNAWMTSFVFKNWFHCEFVPHVREFLASKVLPQKAILLLDNAACHPVEELKSNDGLIVAMNLPPNCTALIQPLDQNVINLIKLHYKKQLLTHLLGEKGTNLEFKIKNFNLKNAVQILDSSWDKVSVSNIQNSWNALLKFSSEWSEEDNMPLNILQNIIREENADLTTIGTLVTQIGTEHHFTNADINNWIHEEFVVESNEEQMELSGTESEDLYDSAHEEKKIKVDDAIKSINICIQWALENDMPTTSLYELRDSAVILKNNLPKKQLKISSFFKNI